MVVLRLLCALFFGLVTGKTSQNLLSVHFVTSLVDIRKLRWHKMQYVFTMDFQWWLNSYTHHLTGP